MFIRRGTFFFLKVSVMVMTTEIGWLCLKELRSLVSAEEIEVKKGVDRESR